MKEKVRKVYECDYCGKTLLSKNGTKLHEQTYCKHSPIVKEKKQREINECDHIWVTSYRFIPGEAVQEPDYDYCIECNVKKHEVIK